MQVKKADDYQSWYIKEGNEGLLIDPWFDFSLVDGKGWFLQRNKEKTSNLSQAEIALIKNIIITAPFGDHLHLKTLREFPKANIWCSNQVKKILLKNYFKNKIFELSAESNQVGTLKVQAFPAGFPYNTTAKCLLISNKEGFKVFHEGHVVNKVMLKKNNLKADIAILTADEVKFFGILTLSMNLKNAIDTCKLLESKKLFITGSNPQHNTGLINNFLKLRKLDIGSIEDNIEILYEPGSSLSL